MYLDTGDSERASNLEKSGKSRGLLGWQVNGIVPELAVRPVVDVEKTAPSVNHTGTSWRISSIFGGSENHTAVKENVASKSFSEPVQSIGQGFSTIHLSEPPSVVRASEDHSEEKAIEIVVTKLLVRSYYDIVRKKIQDSVPKAIMHFLVNHTKRELPNVLIKRLYRDNLFEEMLQEPDEVTMKRKRTRETLRVLQQAFQTLDELPLEAETVERDYSLSTDPTGLPKIHGLPSSSFYNTISGSNEPCTAPPKDPETRMSSHSGELHSSWYGNADSNVSGRNSMPGPYPNVDV